ncbi:S41 family peptidase [Alkalihalobacillus trypoxylicola]|uniref:Tail specific protease domain-containing protein n=1 Tax=Alkalihalobacillus trypoxylicola TaxID=519424 RepID=A0A162DGJ2_9BACI|nr:S41 family peptidase [Alkalihalobacillus trypoxylicola]KYG29560.1 hypothetical protein AZF04_08565 [Alkalihalobacillus trypoxylicola]
MRKKELAFFCIFIFSLIGCRDEGQSVEYLSVNDKKEDLQELINILIEVHPDPKRNIGDSEWNRLVKDLQDSIKEPRTKDEFMIELMSFIQNIGDAHTYLLPKEIHDEKIFPVKIEMLKEGLVVSDTFDHQLKKGDLIVNIGDLELEQLTNHMEKIVAAENQYWKQVMIGNLLNFEFVLDYLKVLKNGKVAVRVEREGEFLDIEVELIEFETFQNLVMKQNKSFDWKLLSHDDIRYGYFKLNQCLWNDEYRNELASFFKEVDNQSIERIILDLRDNGGGDSRVINEFITYLDIEEYPFFNKK